MNVLSSSLYPVVHFTPSYPTSSKKAETFQLFLEAYGKCVFRAVTGTRYHTYTYLVYSTSFPLQRESKTENLLPF